MRNSTAMQTVRSASCLSMCNAVRRATLITAPGELRDDVSTQQPHTPERPCDCLRQIRSLSA